MAGVFVAVVGGTGYHDHRVDAIGGVDAREEDGPRGGEADRGHGHHREDGRDGGGAAAKGSGSYAEQSTGASCARAEVTLSQRGPGHEVPGGAQWSRLAVSMVVAGGSASAASVASAGVGGLMGVVVDGPVVVGTGVSGGRSTTHPAVPSGRGIARGEALSIPTAMASSWLRRGGRAVKRKLSARSQLGSKCLAWRVAPLGRTSAKSREPMNVHRSGPASSEVATPSVTSTTQLGVRTLPSILAAPTLRHSAGVTVNTRPEVTDSGDKRAGAIARRARESSAAADPLSGPFAVHPHGCARVAERLSSPAFGV